MINEKKIIVCSPGGAVTGGPELLHQLVDTLRQHGHLAYIAYFPFNVLFTCPEVYKKYNAPQIKLSNIHSAFYIVPETAVWILKRIHHTKAAVWWLSVDNYFYATHQSLVRDLYMRYRSLLGLRLPLYRLRKYKHFVQSKYAEDFLAKAGISSASLSDYLGSEHLQPRVENLQRKNIIVYNPQKGQKQTRKIRDINPDIEFVPIENLTPHQVAVLFESAKLYVDFGCHPGKDRLPREAAMAGCCVITGRQGSAKYFEDVSIPDKYKLDDVSEGYLTAFRPLVKDIFANYEHHVSQFSYYREKILFEPTTFIQQIESIFGRRD